MGKRNRFTCERWVCSKKPMDRSTFPWVIACIIWLNFIKKKENMPRLSHVTRRPLPFSKRPRDRRVPMSQWDWKATHTCCEKPTETRKETKWRRERRKFAAMIQSSIATHGTREGLVLV